MRRYYKILLFIFILLILPLFHLKDYHLRLITTIFFWITLSQCWNIMSGYTGYIDFGPVAYFGLGAYTTAILMTKYKIGFFPSLILSGVFSSILSLIVGVVALRIKGAYFAIATFAFAEAMKQIFLEFDRLFHVDFFGGSHGITLPIGPGHFFFYYIFFSLALITFLITCLIERSKLGYGLKAIKEAEEAAELIGIDTLRIKVYAYGISAFFIGISGGANAYWITYITPADVFSIHITIQMIINTLLGGMGTVFGPAVGSTFLTLVAEPLWARFPYEYLVFLGIIIVFVITKIPKGLCGYIRWKRY